MASSRPPDGFERHARHEPVESIGPCPLCGRQMMQGASVDRHHWQPKSLGGREWSWLHRICHRKIHAVLTESEIAVAYSDAESLRRHPEIAYFLRWLARRPFEFMSPHRRGRR